MKLLLDTVRLLAGKLVAILLLATVIVAGAFFWSWTRSQKELQGRVAELRIEVESAYHDWQTNRARALDMEMRLHRLEASRPNPILHPNNYLAWRTEMQATTAAVDAARAARDRAKTLHDDTRSRLDGFEARIDTTLDALWKTALQTWWTIAVAVAVFLLGPFAWKAVWYYVIAPCAGRSPPMRVLGPDPALAGSCIAGVSAKTIEVLVEPDSPLLARMEWVQQYGPGLSKRTRFLLDWNYPFISYASGLREMTEIRVRPEHAADRVLLTSADDPNAYLVPLELDHHPGIVLKPGVVVAVRGSVTLHSRWRFDSLHAWISGRLRHLYFSGTGTLYLTGHGGLDWYRSPSPVVVEEALVLGYDGRSGFATGRTETFWPYFRDRTSLFDYQFGAGESFLRQTSAPPSTRARSNPLARMIDAILNTAGKVLGF